jgi:hypothetical protein
VIVAAMGRDEPRRRPIQERFQKAVDFGPKVTIPTGAAEHVTGRRSARETASGGVQLLGDQGAAKTIEEVEAEIGRPGR